MNTGTVNAQIFQQLSYIADDAHAMEKVLKAIKKIVAKKDEEEKAALGKNELKEELEQAFKEVKAYREGKLSLKPVEELLDE